ncbi:MAG: outer membrane protein assembly factor BamE [Opitutae bacterium]|nr:outer membrane protein assembly factor BamE [Opitutae bacterium]MDG2345291.1 outer membrane protein assembly factor BamE [Opitutae bacterium]
MKNIYNKHLLQCVLSGLVLFSSPSMTVAAEVTKEEFLALQKRVEELESAVRVVKNTQVEAIATETFAAMPMTQDDRNSLIENVVEKIQAREESANFPWMEASKWVSLRKGMTPEEVVTLLEQPTLNEPSLHKRVDFVYTYQGRRVATAKKVTGIIRFYKGKVIAVEAPDL